MVGIFNENAKSHVDKIWRGQEGPPTEKKLTVIPFCQTVSTSKTTILERDYRFFAAFLSEIDLDIVDT